VALANHLAIDVSIAEPDMTYCAAVAVGVHYAHLGLFAIYLVGERLLGPKGPRLAALGGVDSARRTLMGRSATRTVIVSPSVTPTTLP
jgi:hypothetical protein